MRFSLARSSVSRKPRRPLIELRPMSSAYFVSAAVAEKPPSTRGRGANDVSILFCLIWFWDLGSLCFGMNRKPEDQVRIPLSLAPGLGAWNSELSAQVFEVWQRGSARVNTLGVETSLPQINFATSRPR